MASLGARGALSTARTSSRIATAISSTPVLTTRRAFSSLPHLRPTILPTSSAVFRPCNSSNTLLSRLPTTPTTSSSGEIADIVPKASITAHPVFGGQIRCGPRPTMATTSRLVRKRRHGFLSRVRTRNGRRTLQRRRDKNRSILSN
ncbi:Uu.00g086190.m01.CDS01 [Anthostomella pinea]|uniref:Uu.00g086190.m01.CDS01 n=1 Tax=Anthostomella pinea TaxID=933095 RepID=A0AAI8VGP5_9PEZI|nr:Uu.00g086190.m01.CDS01 [Anthostomella pinea]